MNTLRNASLAVAAAAVLVLTTACGEESGKDGGGGGEDGRRTGAASAAQPGSSGYGDYASGGANAQGAAAKPAGQLTVWNSPALGRVVTDGAGLTLYRFDKDTAAPPASHCEGDCAKAWPVVPANGVTAAPGVDPSFLGQVTRSDGTEQLTIGGWPVYRYAKDTKAGEAKGQGVGGTWFAAAPDGKKAGATTAADSGASSGGDSGARPAGLPGLSTRKDPKLGDVVVDRDGMTVYRFTKDSAWPMKSACTGECLEKWPVVAPVDKNDTRGILRKGYVTFDRPDGVKQQTIDCWPLYTFAGDAKPGDINGQGVGGTWFAVTPQGKLVKAPR
ncbi:SCO0930 family lipoprotein [Streptomyces sp. NPDC047315]|uniref:SCO0930 family lipoprotein n=1 Tax=Streptomyces sp. NPDC047315 TaxID=3155142 RepID=UPI0033CCE1FA